MFDSSMSISGFDDEIFAAIGEEERRLNREERAIGSAKIVVAEDFHLSLG